jgi:hypothetical protein
MNKADHIQRLKTCFDSWQRVESGLKPMEYYHGWFFNGVFFSKGDERITEEEVFNV